MKKCEKCGADIIPDGIVEADWKYCRQCFEKLSKEMELVLLKFRRGNIIQLAKQIDRISGGGRSWGGKDE